MLVRECACPCSADTPRTAVRVLFPVLIYMLYRFDISLSSPDVIIMHEQACGERCVWVCVAFTLSRSPKEKNCERCAYALERRGSGREMEIRNISHAPAPALALPSSMRESHM